MWCVDLALLPDPGLLPHTVAAALGMREQPGRTIMESLVEFLRAETLLPVLANCEHAVSASAHLADALLRGARRRGCWPPAASRSRSPAS